MNPFLPSALVRCHKRFITAANSLLLHLLRILKKDWRPRSAFLLLLKSFLFTSGSENTTDGVFPFATTNVLQLKYIGVEILVVAVMNMFLRSVADSEISKSADPEHVWLWRRVPLRAPSHHTTSTLLNASASWQTICLTHSQSVRQTWMRWSEQLFSCQHILWLVKWWPVAWNRNGHIGRKSIDLEALSDTKCWSLCLLVYMVSHLRAPTSLSYQPPTLLGAPSINPGAPILTIRSCIQSNMKEAIQDIRQTSSSILMQRLVSNWGIIQDPLKYPYIVLTGHRIPTKIQ